MRSEADFTLGHHSAAVNIPLEQLAERVHELPPRGEAVAIFDADPARLAAAAAFLRERGFPDPTPISLDAAGESEIVTGVSRRRLWRPNPFLAQLAAEGLLPMPSAPADAALELACGTGRDAVFLAELGWSVTAVDVLPDALDRGRVLARRAGVSVDFTRRDVEADGPPPSPTASVGFSLLTVFFFLHRPLLPALRAALAPGGVLVYETFLHAHRDRFGKPSRDGHLLRPGELAEHFADWEVLRCQEGPTPSDAPTRITARLAARRPR